MPDILFLIYYCIHDLLLLLMTVKLWYMQIMMDFLLENGDLVITTWTMIRPA